MVTMTSLGLTLPEARAMLAMSHHLPADHAIACLSDPRDGLFAQVVKEGLGVVAAVARVNGHLALLDFKRCLDGASGRYDAIEDVVNALRLSLAEPGLGPYH